jgi:hypothetical protein
MYCLQEIQLYVLPAGYTAEVTSYVRLDILPTETTPEVFS